MKTPEELPEELDRQAVLYVSLKARNDVSYYVGMDCYKAGYQAAKDQLFEETGFRIKLFKNDDDAKAAYQEALEEVELDKIWQQGYQAAQEHAHAALKEAEAEIDRLQTKLSDAGILTTEHLVDASKMVSISATLNNWISVKDRLPEDGTGWLAVYGSIPYLGFFVGPGCYDYAKKEWLSRFLNYRARKDTTGLVTDQIEYLPFEQVTHWQPLPKPPTESK